jgi:membrane-associated phospholipid phosphatase
MSPTVAGEPVADVDYGVLGRLDACIWSMIGLLGAAVLTTALLFSFRVGWASFAGPAIGAVVLTGGAIFYDRYRPDARLSSALGCTAQLVVFTAFAAPLSYLAAAAAFPLQDRLFDMADQALGLDWLAMLAWMNTHPALHTVFSLAYMSIQPQAALAVLALALTARHARLRIFLLAFMFAVVVTIAVSMLLPARGVWGFYALGAGDYPSIVPVTRDVHLHVIDGLRNGSFRLLGAVGSEGIITFPSLHAALAMIFIFALWPVPVLRWVSLFINVLMLISTPIDGGHYFIDVVAGILVALVCWPAAASVARRLAAARLAPTPEFAAETGAVPGA